MNCGEKFYRPPSQNKNPDRQFCSPKCYGEWKYAQSRFNTLGDCPYEWGYVLGILCSDGSKPYKLKRTMAVALTCKDKEMVDRFLECVEVISGRKYSIGYNQKRAQWYTTVTFGKMIRFIQSLGDFSWQNWLVPEVVLKGNLQRKKGFLNGFLDGDGSVVKTPYHPIISFRSANQKGLKSLKDLLSLFGIESKLYGKKYYLLSIHKKSMVLKYFSKIGITLTRKRTSFTTRWKEYEGKVKYQFWTRNEKTFLNENYDKLTITEIAEELNRPIKGIYGKARQLGLIGNNLWDKDEVEYLIENYGKLHHKKIAEHLSRTPKAVMIKAQRLELKSMLTNRNL